MLHPEAQVFLFTLICVILFSLYRLMKADDYLRLSTSLVMLLAWTATMTAQLSLGEFAPVGTFVFIDFVTVVTFTWLANAYNKIWIWWIAAFHTLSLGVNFAFVLNGQESTYLYLSLMTGLSYLSLLWIFTGEKLSQLIGKGVKSGFASINPSSVRSSRDTNHES